MTYFIRNGNTYIPTPESALDIQTTLPPAVYSVGFDKLRNQFFFSKIDDFVQPSKMYGDVDAKAGHMVLEACQMADKDVNYKDYDWDGDGTADVDDMGGWAFFNQWRSSDRVIYRRESPQ